MIKVFSVFSVGFIINKHAINNNTKEILEWLTQLSTTHLHVAWELFCGGYKLPRSSWADLRNILNNNPQELINILHTLTTILVSELDYSKFNDIFYNCLRDLESKNINENYAALAHNEILAERILSRYFLNLNSSNFKFLNFQTLVDMGLQHPKLAEMIIRLAPKESKYSQYVDQLSNSGKNQQSQPTTPALPKETQNYKLSSLENQPWHAQSSTSKKEEPMAEEIKTSSIEPKNL